MTLITDMKSIEALLQDFIIDFMLYGNMILYGKKLLLLKSNYHTWTFYFSTHMKHAIYLISVKQRKKLFVKYFFHPSLCQNPPPNNCWEKEIKVLTLEMCLIRYYHLTFKYMQSVFKMFNPIWWYLLLTSPDF